ncbi:hypothetical protein [Neolewinella sp.]|uniref:hypothetical protein n=1 Tax=Neolewinella sp. TaxID=2993543 RepID=UPI003B523C24
MSNSLPQVLLLLFGSCLNQANEVAENTRNSSDNTAEVQTLTTKSFEHCPKCDVKLLVVFEQNDANIDTATLANFLCIYSPTACANNVEFKEFYIEVLFDLLAAHPNMLITELGKLEDINTKAIVKLIESPINDEYDIQDLVNSIDESVESSKEKSMVIRALTVASSK